MTADTQDAVTGAAITQWFAELQRVADILGLSDLITTLEDHGGGFTDGFTPGQELTYQIELAQEG